MTKCESEYETCELCETCHLACLVLLVLPGPLLASRCGNEISTARRADPDLLLLVQPWIGLLGLPDNINIFDLREKPCIRSFSFVLVRTADLTFPFLAKTFAAARSFLVFRLHCMASFPSTPPDLTTRLSMPLSDNEQSHGTLKPPRRVHKKSRKGCANCKARRVKVRDHTQTVPTAWAIRQMG
jgi:hypothetical protein